MGILNFIDRLSVQTAVYWGSPVPNGYGGSTFADAIEIDCRWENKNQIVVGTDGKEITVDVIILTNTDMEIGGFLYLGSLTDLESDPNPDDSGVDAYEILSKRSIPLIRSTTEFVKTYYLNKNHRSVREV